MLNKHTIKSCAAGLTAAIMLCTSTAFAESTKKTATAVYNNIKIVVDEARVTPKDVNGNIVDPFIIDGTTYLPVRALANALGKGVSWDQETSTVIIGGEADASSSDDSSATDSSESKGYASVEVNAVYNDIKIVVDGNEIVPTDVNGNVVEPFIIDGTTYLPVRALANALGEEVAWNQATSTVYIGERPFFVDSSTLKQFADKTLATVGNTEVKGAYYNIYVAQNCNFSSFKYYCDNYSSDKTLQTLTIDSIPAAEYLTELTTETLMSSFAIYDYAEKNNFSQRADIQESLNSIWSSYRSQFATDAEYKEFLNECGITDADYEKFVKTLSVASLFGNDLYSRYMQVPYTDDELKAICEEKYITAKHILVADEETAKSIITKLNSGTSFDTLSEEYNIDPGSTVSGYTFTYDEMVKEFEDAAFALKENTYTSTPVKSTYGYHVILRLPLDQNWIESNKSTIQSTLASNDTNFVINGIIADTDIAFTDEYNSYVSTIK